MLYSTLNEEIRDICLVQGRYPEGWQTFDSCPLCSSSNIKRFFKKLEMVHDRCKDCDFIFLNPVPDENILNRLYSGEYMTAIRKYIAIPKALEGRVDTSTAMPLSCYEEIVSVLADKVHTGNWLDVGGGIGTFLHMVNRSNHSFDCYLNEKNRESAEFAKSHYGINVLAGSAREIEETELRFDIISFNAVLEHVPDPRRFFTDYIRLLKPGGWIFINIPNYTRLNRWFSRKDSFSVIPPFHVNHFNRENIQTFLSGFSGVSDIEIWDSGHAAFHLTDLVIDAENFDCRIPREKLETLEAFRVKKIPKGRNLVRKGLYFSNRLMAPVFRMADGRVYLNVVAKIISQD